VFTSSSVVLVFIRVYLIKCSRIVYMCLLDKV